MMIRFIRRLLAQALAFAVVLSGGLTGVAGANEGLILLLGEEFAGPASGVSATQLAVGLAGLGFGALIGSVGALALILPLFFIYPNLGKPLFRSAYPKTAIRFYRQYYWYGSRLAEYASKEIDHIETCDELRKDGDGT